MEKRRYKIAGVLGGLVAIVVLAYAQIETDPIASQMVRQEEISRQMNDREIQQDIRYRDNQTAQEISRQSEQQKRLLDQQIAAVEKTFELLNQTYNTTDKLLLESPMIQYINHQRRTANLHFQIAQVFRFGSSILEQESRARVIFHLKRSSELNMEGWNVMKTAMRDSNNMDIKGRLDLISQANELTNQSERELIQALEVSETNSKMMQTMSHIQQLPHLFQFKLD